MESQVLFTGNSRPFDAQKLADLIQNDDFWESYSFKGHFWIAADHTLAFEWGQAGGISNISVSGSWWADVPKEEWTIPEEERPTKRKCGMRFMEIEDKRLFLLGRI